MFSRKNEDSFGVVFPSDYIAEIIEMLYDCYRTELDQRQLKIHVYGESFQNEILIICSLLDLNDPEGKIPITLFLSIDVEREEKKDSKEYQKALTHLIDGLGVVLDHCFLSFEEIEYHGDWKELQQQHRAIFYKISRENVSLSLEANAYLRQH